MQIDNITTTTASGVQRTFSAVVPSSGDRTPAVWRDNAASPIIGHRPLVQMTTRDNGAGNGRILDIRGVFPITGTDPSDRPVVLAKVPLSLSATLPTNVDALQVFDAYVQFVGILGSELIKNSVAEGYAPR